MPAWTWSLIPAGIAAAWLWNRAAEAREAGHVAPPGIWVRVGDRRLHVVIRGHGGPAVVIESGGASSSVMWWPIQDRLAAHGTVVTYDRAGLGWSDPAPLPRSIEERADELARMLEAIDVPPPYVLVGLSYGGPIIRRYASSHPERVAGLVFVDSAHESVFDRPAAQKYLRRSAAMLRVVAALAGFGVLRLFRLRGIPSSPTALPYSEGQIDLLKRRFPPAHSFAAGADEFRSMTQIGRSMASQGQPGSLGATPVSVVSHGQPFPGPFAVLEQGHREGQEALAALSSNSQLVIAKESSHAIPLQEPLAVMEAILWVLEAARVRTASMKPLSCT